METTTKELQLENGKTITIGNTAEKIFLRRRKHWFVLVHPILYLFLGYIFILTVSFIASYMFPQLRIVALPFAILITILFINIVVKLIIDWLFHFYVLTDKRILDIQYSPLFKDVINNVILSQVKTTEVSFESKGFVNRFFNIGDVILTFDRPTHEDEFTLADIADPKDICFLMANLLDITRQNFYGAQDMMAKPVWTRTKNDKKHYRITDEIFPDANFRIMQT